MTAASKTLRPFNAARTADPEVSDVSPSASDAQGRKALLKDAYERFAGPLKAYLMRTVDEAEAEDLLHEVYLRLARHTALGAIQNLQAFMYATAINLLRDRWRRCNARFAPNWVSFEDCCLVAEGCDPSELLDWQDRLKRVNVALAALPPKPRRAFVLSRKQSCSYAEIARQLNVSVSMIEKHISMALGQLRTAL